MTHTDWELITDTACPEALQAVETLVASIKNSEEQAQIEPKREFISKFYSQLGRAEQVASVYRVVETSEDWGRKLGLELVGGLQLLDIPSVSRLLEHEKGEVRVAAVDAMLTLKPEYTVDDAVGFDQLRQKLIEVFTEKPIQEKKGMLGRVSKVWVCGACGHENGEGYECCSECSADRHGLPRRFGGLDRVLAEVDRRLTVLRREFVGGRPAGAQEA